MNIEKVKIFLEKNKIQFLQNEKLSNHSSIKIGGTCDFFVLPKDIFEVIKLLEYAKKNDIKYCVVGNGTNTLFSDFGTKNLIIRTKLLKNCQIFKNKLLAESGLGLFELGKICAKNGLSGIEFCYGIPGTVGGAMITNAGAFEQSIGDYVDFVKVYQNGEIFNLSKGEMKFSYRHSILENTDAVILGVQFNLKKGNTNDIKELQKKYFEQKLSSQPYNELSLGSVFKRNSDYPPVSKLIDQLGLKGFSIGGASVSKKHAGFLINNGECTCKDFVLLIKYIQKKIYDNFGFVPELEIKLVGEM